MKDFSATTTIRARPDAVWNILTDADGYPQWNPVVVGVDGTIAEGQRIVAHISRFARTPRAVKYRISLCDRPVQMIWYNALPVGLYVGYCNFSLTQREDGTVEFSMNGGAAGVLEGWFGCPVGQADADAFAAGLKKRAERT